MKRLLCRLFGHKVFSYWAVRAPNTPASLRCQRCGDQVPLGEW